ncbi:ATP-binding protein [Synechocystis sp. PCC 6714]|uniref:ATP-binding protein n=1 Tax=Synechocystis sp. (strain PCC 6714) TaxID=1147 RepID=UPI001EE69045|nr:ATP-binding protein [Synechocystis sp. PCC 6714]
MDYQGKELPEESESGTIGGLEDYVQPQGNNCYRQPEMDGLLNSLYSARSVLVTSGEGMGKTYLVRRVWERLLAEGVVCEYFEPATPKTVLMAIADMAGVDIKNLEGRSKTVEVLKQELIQWFSVNRAVLIFDDAHYLEVKFRLWLKKLKDVGVPILLAATNPPRTDLFIYVPRIELKPLAE